MNAALIAQKNAFEETENNTQESLQYSVIFGFSLDVGVNLPCYAQPKSHSLFRTVKNSIKQCFAAKLFSLRSDVAMLNNIVDDIEQCWQQNIVQCCFQQS